jgi:septum formation protein
MNDSGFRLAAKTGSTEGPVFTEGPVLVLASRSPQRRAILEQLGIRFEVHPADVSEETAGEPEQVVTANALRKARAVAEMVGADRLVLGADTEVWLDGQVYGKPDGLPEARNQLERLSGRTHEVWSAVALLEGGRGRTATARTSVTFKQLDARLLDWYLESGEWNDRAGSYAIQGRGAALVECIEGDFWNVVGLPIPALLDLAPDLVSHPE